MENNQIRQLIRQELPVVLRQDLELREWVRNLMREQYADKAETESRFDRLLDELRRDREENTRKWEENTRKWEENTARLDRMLDNIEAQARKHDQGIGALGARWGMQAEQSFRNGLKAILERSFGVEVLNITEYDDAGEVFGRPDQIELDIIVINGTLILCEIKSSMSKSDLYAFERKVAFYEKRHARKATRKLVISPMVDPKAQEIAQKLGIEVYSYVDSVQL